MKTIDPATAANSPDPETIRANLEGVIASPEFAGSTRLQEFLVYVVEESLAGRAARIRGKTIAEDVYGRSPVDQSVVRVDAGRLRRRLDHYYAGSGRAAALHIEIPSGGYAPSFHIRDQQSPAGEGATSHGRFIGPWAIIVLLGVIAAGVFVWTQLSTQPDEPADERLDTMSDVERQALFDKSPATLQAVDFAQNARGLIFPPIDEARLQSALELFERAIELDGDYFGGYAGAAQTLALGALVRGSGNSGPDLARARTMAERARQADPTSAWVQSALAWVAFVAGEFERAVELSDRAVQIDPADAHVRDFHGMIAVLGGEFERAAQIVQPHLDDASVLRRTVHLNIDALANYHLGRYQATVDSINKITSVGGASSSTPLTTAYLAAAQAALGNLSEAEDVIATVQRAWPGFRLDLLLRRIHRNPRHADDVLSRLHAAGWRPPDGTGPIEKQGVR